MNIVKNNIPIPRTIHYCWFGGKSLPKSARKCINSWAKYFPDYEIMEWNESNYDVRITPYVSEAYDAKMYAFVSDYARFDILYQYGGIYFDTDVEVIKSFRDIIEHGPFMGCEIDGGVNGIKVAPGLGIAAIPGMSIYREIINCYSRDHFITPNGSFNNVAVVEKTTNILKEHGLKNELGIQELDELTVYPREYFNPLQDSTGVMTITDNTHSIHWYSKTWMGSKAKIRSWMTRPFHRLFGDDCFKRLKR